MMADEDHHRRQNYLTLFYNKYLGSSGKLGRKRNDKMTEQTRPDTLIEESEDSEREAQTPIPLGSPQPPTVGSFERRLCRSQTIEDALFLPVSNSRAVTTTSSTNTSVTKPNFPSSVSFSGPHQSNSHPHQPNNVKSIGKNKNVPLTTSLRQFRSFDETMSSNRMSQPTSTTGSRLMSNGVMDTDDEDSLLRGEIGTDRTGRLSSSATMGAVSAYLLPQTSPRLRTSQSVHQISMSESGSEYGGSNQRLHANAALLHSQMYFQPSASASLNRGSLLRTSMPAMLRRKDGAAMGNALLVYQEEVKRVWLPDKIAHIDTIRALFVRSFPKRLTLEWFNGAGRAIYVLDRKNSIFYELENLRDACDNCVLKAHDSFAEELLLRTSGGVSSTSGLAPGLLDRSVSSNAGSSAATQLALRAAHLDLIQREERQLCFSDSEIDSCRVLGGKMNNRVSTGKQGKQQAPRMQPASQGGSPQHTPSCWGTRTPANSRLDHHPDGGGMGNPAARGVQMLSGGVGVMSGTSTLPTGGHYHCSQPAGVVALNQHSATLPHPHQHHHQHMHTLTSQGEHELVCTCPPELHQAILEHQMSLQPFQLHDPSGFQLSGSLTNFSVPLPNPPCPAQTQISAPAGQLLNNSSNLGYSKIPDEPTEAQARIAEMESQLAHLTAWVQTLQERGGGRVEAPPPTGPLVLSCPPANNNHTPSNSSLDSAYSARSTTSSEASSHSTHTLPTRISPQLARSLGHTRSQLHDLRGELLTLRRIQESNCAAVKEQMETMIRSFKQLVTKVPGGNEAPVRAERSRVDAALLGYQSECQAVDRRLGDLEAAIEDMRVDVLSRKCRVNISEVEALSQHLGVVNRSLTQLKSQFPRIQTNMKPMLQAEMEIVMRDEKFLKTELGRLEGSMKRSKKLTGTLFTLKRLGTVQQHSPPDSGPRLCTLRDPDVSDKRLVLQSIEAVVPDHEARIKRIQAVDELRERKKRILSEEVPVLPDRIIPPDPRDTSVTPSPEDFNSSNQQLPGLSTENNGVIQTNHNPEDSPMEHVTSFCSPQDPAPVIANGVLPIPISTILKAPSSSTNSNRTGGRTSKVVFSDTVMVEDGSEYLRLNYLDDDDHDNTSTPVVSMLIKDNGTTGADNQQSDIKDAGHDSSSTDQHRKVPPPPPPRKSSRISGGPDDWTPKSNNEYENCDFPPPPPPPQPANSTGNNAKPEEPTAGKNAGVQRWLEGTILAAPTTLPSPCESDVWQRQNEFNTNAARAAAQNGPSRAPANSANAAPGSASPSPPVVPEKPEVKTPAK